jgi:hypothetical protein
MQNLKVMLSVWQNQCLIPMQIEIKHHGADQAMLVP